MGLQGDVLAVTMPVDLELAWVDPRDIGDVAAARLLSADWRADTCSRSTGPSTSPSPRPPRSSPRPTGRPARAEQIPDEAMRSALG